MGHELMRGQSKMQKERNAKIRSYYEEYTEKRISSGRFLELLTALTKPADCVMDDPDDEEIEALIQSREAESQDEFVAYHLVMGEGDADSDDSRHKNSSTASDASLRTRINKKREKEGHPPLNFPSK